MNFTQIAMKKTLEWQNKVDYINFDSISVEMFDEIKNIEIKVRSKYQSKNPVLLPELPDVRQLFNEDEEYVAFEKYSEKLAFIYSTYEKQHGDIIKTLQDTAILEAYKSCNLFVINNTDDVEASIKRSVLLPMDTAITFQGFNSIQFDHTGDLCYYVTYPHKDGDNGLFRSLIPLFNNGLLQFLPNISLWEEGRPDDKDKLLFSSFPSLIWGIKRGTQNIRLNHLERILLDSISFEIPYLAEIPLSLFSEMCVEHGDSLESFKLYFAKHLNNMNLNNPREVLDFELEIKEQINKINKSMKRETFKLKKMIGYNSIATAVATMYVFADINSLLQVLAGIGGVTGLFTVFKTLIDYQITKTKIRDQECYFLYLIHKKVEKGGYMNTDYKHFADPTIKTQYVEVTTDSIHCSDSNYRFDVAFSFPGEQRSLVSAIAERLSCILSKERILYDEYHIAEFAMPNLDLHLQKLYHDKSKLIIVFLCSKYNSKEWTGIEWRAIRDFMNQDKENAKRIMFVRCDIGSVDGVFGTIDGYIDAKKYDAFDISKFIHDRLIMIL